MSIEGRESPGNTGLPRAPPPSIESPANTGLPSTPPPSFGNLAFDMKNYTFSTRRNQSNLDTASAEGLSGSLQANPPIFSLSLGGGHGNVTDEMEISPWDVKTAPASNNEHLSRQQNIMMEVERLKLELECTRGMLYAIARQEAMKANITANELKKQIKKEIARQLDKRENQQKRDAKIRARIESEVRKKAHKASESKLPYVQSGHMKDEMDAMPPKHFLCPILQEVMDDPHIAADGFTYEYSTINTWLEKKNTSPETNQTLDHKFLIPNDALRRFKPHDIPAFVMENAPNFCTVHIAPECKLSSVHLTSSAEFKFSNTEDSSNLPSGFSDMTGWSSPRTGGTESQSDVSIHAYPQPLSFQRGQSLSNIIQVPRSSASIPASTISNVESRSASISMRSQTSCIGVIYDSGTSRSDFLSENSSTMSIEEREYPGNTRLPRTPVLSFGNHSFMEIDTFSASRNQFNLDTASIKTASASNNEHLSQEQNIMMEEVERLKLELKHTQNMYAVAREEVKNAKITVNELSVQRIHEVRKFEEAKVREEIARKIAAQEKARSQTAMRQAETARQLAEREAQQRRDAELRAKKESEEKWRAQIAFAYTYRGYRRYSIEEIQSATDFFSDSLKIGVGGYGAVYMGTLKHTKVAIRVLKNEANQGIHQFQREIEVLSRIRHPHMVILLGACPEHGYLVYEYMENGSLEDRLLCRDNSAPLPWFSRFRIIWEVASALLFLHSAQPEPIFHRALKLENILLDYNFVSKIVGTGLARLVPANTTTMVTQYNDTAPADTFCYTDPECQRTSGLGPKSDLYALGIIILQLLSAKPPETLTDVVETAIKDGSFRQILDKSAGNWPVGEARELAILGLKCADFQRRDGPDLEKDVLPELERFKAFADAQTRHIREEIDVMPPSHFFCPILKEVMDNPHIAADGFTYEYSSINTWLENNNTSPMTNQALDNKFLIPNHALRSAILEWKIKSGFNNADYDTEQY